MSVRVSIPDCAIEVIDRISRQCGLTRQQAIVRAIGTLQACEQAAAEGAYVGVANREVLERVLVGPGGEAK